MKHKRLIGILSALLLVAVMIPTAYAYMVHKSQTISNVFIPGRVTCEIHETFEKNVKKSITVKNTGNVDAYIRVRLVFHWEDSKGNVVARNMEYPSVNFDEDHWVKGDDYTYYYKTPIAPEAFTENLLDAEITMDPVTVEETISGNEKVYYYYYPVMEVLAEAVQSNPEDAAEHAWGVTITDGEIQ